MHELKVACYMIGAQAATVGSAQLRGPNVICGACGVAAVAPQHLVSCGPPQ